MGLSKLTNVQMDKLKSRTIEKIYAPASIRPAPTNLWLTKSRHPHWRVIPLPPALILLLRPPHLLLLPSPLPRRSSAKLNLATCSNHLTSLLRSETVAEFKRASPLCACLGGEPELSGHSAALRFHTNQQANSSRRRARCVAISR